jgi:hypothetical protein
LRVTWLKIIATLHRASHSFGEAAQAHLVVAYLIVQFLELHNGTGALHEFGPVSEGVKQLCPYLASPLFQGITKEDADNQATALRLDCWTLDGLATELFEAGNMLSEEGLGKDALRCFNFVIMMRLHQNKHLDLLKCYAAAQMCCKVVIKDVNPKPEEKFFRVRFIGKLFDKQLNDKAFIYRGESGQRLMDFSNFVLKRCADNSAAYGTSRCELLGNDKDVTTELLEQTKVLYVQVARVYPVVAAVSGSRESLSVFQLDMAHSETEKKQQQLVILQGRKKIYYTTACPFPYFNRRILIVDTKNVILNPLDNAIELMTSRVQSIREATLSKSATVISGILYGNVMTTISEGPEAIAAAFLTESHTDSQTETLRQLMREFLLVTEEALNLHEVIMEPNMQGWQKEARERFALMNAKLKFTLK